MTLFEESNGTWPLEVVQMLINKSSELYRVDVSYPVYSLPGYDLGIFNTGLYDTITEQVENFTEIAEGLSPPAGATPELLGEYWTYTAIRRFITTKFSLQSYFGGAHPSHDILTMTFDTSNNTILSLSDLFKDNEDYLQHLSELVEKALFEKYPQLAFAFRDPTYREGFAPHPDNFSRFALTDTGLIIFFREYQVAPYVAGTLEVEIKKIYFFTK